MIRALIRSLALAGGRNCQDWHCGTTSPMWRIEILAKQSQWVPFILVNFTSGSVFGHGVEPERSPFRYP